VFVVRINGASAAVVGRRSTIMSLMSAIVEPRLVWKERVRRRLRPGKEVRRMFILEVDMVRRRGA